MQKRPVASKLNLGAGANWKVKEGWCAVDHGIGIFQVHQAWSIPYPEKSFDTVFCSHVIEHISHFKIEEVLCEINRVMQVGGVLRLLTPDLKKLATAYVNGDAKTMDAYIREDDSGISRELGLGQAFMNFVVSAGYDNFLCDSQLSRPIAGYAHVFCYDFELLSGLLSRYGFGEIRQCPIEESRIPDHKELRARPFDDDKLHSLVVECVKTEDAVFRPYGCLLHKGPHDVVKLAAHPQNTITRFLMRVGSVLDGILYRSIRAVVKGIRRPKTLTQAHS